MEIEFKKNQLPKNLFKRGFVTRLVDLKLMTKEDIIDVNSIEDIISYIEFYFITTKSINKKTTSYGLKNIIERRIGRYVCNGDLIISMIICGYKYNNIDNGPNVYFNVCEKSCRNI